MTSGPSTPDLRPDARGERDSQPEKKKLRLFAAVDLGEAVCAKAAAAAEKVHPLAKHAKWAHSAGFHLTLFFFGWVAPDQVPSLESALAIAVKGHRPLRLAVKGSGTFGSGKKPRVLWLGLSGQTDALAALQASVSAEVSKIGFVPEDRPFSPHLTLARARDPRGDPGLLKCREALAELDCGEGEVGALRLYRSELSPKGPTYTVWREFPLLG